MKVILITAGEKAEVLELAMDKIDYLTMKELLDIDSPVTCVERKIGDKYYDLWLDDEGLLKPEKERIVTGAMVSRTARELLVGNLLIMNHDEEGNSVGLSDDEIAEITRFIAKADDFNTFSGRSKDHEWRLDDCDFGICLVKPHSEFLMYKI